ncbi:MAG: zinc ribbon domain-containing protein [Planctomycetota bacterium]|nr:MAG: zinc ribbon domain-containing protein [Planctomycetota bacterium]
MPTYDYECLECKHTFERFQSITSEPVKTCPVCQGKVRRLIGPGGGLLFKGSGFYITDYRSPSYKQKAKAESGSSSSSNSSSSSSTNQSSSS